MLCSMSHHFVNIIKLFVVRRTLKKNATKRKRSHLEWRIIATLYSNITCYLSPQNKKNFFSTSLKRSQRKENSHIIPLLKANTDCVSSRNHVTPLSVDNAHYHKEQKCSLSSLSLLSLLRFYLIPLQSTLAVSRYAKGMDSHRYRGTDICYQCADQTNWMPSPFTLPHKFAYKLASR